MQVFLLLQQEYYSPDCRNVSILRKQKQNKREKKTFPDQLQNLKPIELFFRLYVLYIIEHLLLWSLSRSRYLQVVESLSAELYYVVCL